MRLLLLLLGVIALNGVCTLGSITYNFQGDGTEYTDASCTAGATPFVLTWSITSPDSVSTQPCTNIDGTNWGKLTCIPADLNGAGNAFTFALSYYADSSCSTTIGAYTATSASDASTCKSIPGLSGRYIKSTSCTWLNPEVAAKSSSSSSSSTGSGTQASSGSVSSTATDEITSSSLLSIYTSGSQYSDSSCTKDGLSFSLTSTADISTGDLTQDCIAVGSRWARGSCQPAGIDDSEGVIGAYYIKYYANSVCSGGSLGSAGGVAGAGTCVPVTTVEGLFVKIDSCTAAGAYVSASVMVLLLLAFVANKLQF